MKEKEEESRNVLVLVISGREFVDEEVVSNHVELSGVEEGSSDVVMLSITEVLVGKSETVVGSIDVSEELVYKYESSVEEIDPPLSLLVVVGSIDTVGNSVVEVDD